MKKILKLIIKIILSYIRNIYYTNKIFYIIDFHNWANSNDAKNLKNFFKEKFIISYFYKGIRNSIIHIGTHYKIFNKDKINLNQSNKLFVFWPHLNKNDSISYKLKKNVDKIDKINTCSNISKKNLIKFGIPENKIVVIPLSIDTKVFSLKNRENTNFLKKKYSIPKNKFVLGSFVKDGNGFGEGLVPKKIKNPNMLINAIKLLKNKNDYFFVLSGPARGYLISALKKMRVRFLHKNCINKKELSDLYKLVDVTVINSKTEGGPYSLLESLSSGVPVISTKVGMSLDILKNNYNGFLINHNDSLALKKKIEFLFENNNLLNSIRKNCRKSVINYSINKVGKLYKKKLYNLI